MRDRHLLFKQSNLWLFVITVQTKSSSEYWVGVNIVFKAEGSMIVCVKYLVTQSCPTLCDPMDYSPPGSSVHGISQTRILAAAAAAKSLQSCLTLCDPIDSSPPGSPIPGILQVRTLEWVAISFSNA